MAQKTKVGGTAYTITHGRAKVGGTTYDIGAGKTKIGGTAKDIVFGTVPYKYQQVAYVESSSTGKNRPHIVMPITTQEGLKIEAVINKYGADDNLDYLGYYEKNASEGLFLSATGSLYTAMMYVENQTVTNATYKSVTNGTTITATMVFGSNGQTTSLTCTGVSGWNKTSTRSMALASTGNPMYLFTHEPSNWCYKGRFGRVTAYNSSNAVIMDLYPVKRKSDNVPGFWDTVSKQFLTNAGSGSFSVGADV